jgi:hypothetical protein
MPSSTTSRIETTMTEKVIEFPKHKVVRDIPLEQQQARQEKADKKFADAIVDDVTGMIITELDNFLIEVEDKQFSKDLILVVDSLKAAVYRSFGLDHALHDFIDKNITLINGEFDNLTNDEIKEKIDQLMEELAEAKNKVDKGDED